jgi:hypothetical protein
MDATVSLVPWSISGFICLAQALVLAMIRETKTRPHRPLQRGCMSDSQVIHFGETTRTMTYAEGLAFIERTRRQLDRFVTALPHTQGESISPGDAAAIRAKLDALEADFRKDLGHN